MDIGITLILPNCFGNTTTFTQDDLQFMKEVINKTWNGIAPDMLIDENDTYTAEEVIVFVLEKYELFTEGDDTIRMDDLRNKFNEVSYDYVHHLIPLITDNETYGY